MLERRNEEPLWHARGARIFPNTASCMRLMRTWRWQTGLRLVNGLVGNILGGAAGNTKLHEATRIRLAYRVRPAFR